ncbi:DUF3667 domain-containing protein [uncultured Chitinophaga sp.]|uniref:DUF3667 domain-containing protein n=1 Tax=uncultured Chitinophaga sp. TaxID=339340 RepID=UPI0025E14D53|nr:DUF3667 domain-containing protein [uncultured Chitinophaga sp.]
MESPTTAGDVLTSHSHATVCKNCGANLDGKFCQQCGQKADIHRITLPHLLHEFFHVLTHADKGILFLAKEMVYKPGVVAAEYIAGQRKKYFNPLSFLVIISAIFALVALNSGYFEAMSAGPSRTSYGKMPPIYAQYMKESMYIVVHHGKMISIILIVPILTFLSWLFFKKKGYNFAENLVLQALIVGQIHLSMILLFIPAYLLFGAARLNNNVFQATFFVYMIVAYRQFFKNSILVTVLKTACIQFLFIVSFWLLIVLFLLVKHLFV